MLAQILVRFGLALTFGYMGVDKFLRPDVWQIQMPPFLEQLGVQFIFVLGSIEVLLALLLVTNRFYRLGALGCVVILIGAIGPVGINDIAARDVGLLASAFALLLPWEHQLRPRAILRSYTNLLKGRPHGGH